MTKRNEFPLHDWWDILLKVNTLESENKQERSIQLWKQAAFSGQHQFQIQQSSHSQVEYIHHVPGLKRTASTNDFCTDHFINLAERT